MSILRSPSVSTFRMFGIHETTEYVCTSFPLYADTGGNRAHTYARSPSVSTIRIIHSKWIHKTAEHNVH